MGIQLCRGSSIIDFSDPCIRSLWSSLLPAGFVFALCIFQIPTLEAAKKLVGAPFRTYMKLQEAEALDGQAEENLVEMGDTVVDVGEVPRVVPLWRTVVLAFVGLVETLAWVSYGSYLFVHDPSGGSINALPLLVAFSWFYTVVRPIARPTATVPFDLFSIYSLQLVAAVLQVGGLIYNHRILQQSPPPVVTTVLLSANLSAVIGLLVIVLCMPLAIPSNRVRKEEIGSSVSPEDYTSLWGWITFIWIYPLIRRGRDTTLNEDDVWNLSPTIQSRPVFIKFQSIIRPTLLRRIFAANSLDLILDFSFTFVSVTFNYGGPFFLKQILDTIGMEEPTPESLTQAYIYAFLAFLCTLLKAEADVQHLWFGRRASTRMRSALMASIYDKALRRKDFSGIVNKDKLKEAHKQSNGDSSASSKSSEDNKKEKKAKEAQADQATAGADVGRIVNLMAIDANTIAATVSGVYSVYGAPFEIMIAGIFLYQLLGWSAFAGFTVFVVGWPLNSYIARGNIKIEKGLLSARDKRMGVMNELIGAVKFIKFFAWEGQWIDRAMDVRKVEMNWLVKARINTALFFVLGFCSPILVSIISFFVFVMQGNQLTIGTAFTAITLFNMIRMPLFVIPSWIAHILHTSVALNRIAVFLEEDEVSEQVSSLKQSCSDPAPPGESDHGLGLHSASFKWNEVEDCDESANGGANGYDNGSCPTPLTSAPFPEERSSATVDATSEISITTQDHRFELRDISVRFPEGKLTLVTGPTASGKTALLMALLGEMTLLPGGRIIMFKHPNVVDENKLVHSISYAAQSPWLRHQSIKDNILFEYPYDEERYNAVIECCALKPDLQILEDGDATEIGARGVSLSGGQKARVALARAVYAPTKYVLLDDPLSAVDSHTARFLFDKLFCGPLLANRTVILVTHHVELVLPAACYLVRMLDGQIDTQGNIKDLQDQGVLRDITHSETVEVQKEEIVKSDHAPVEEMRQNLVKETKQPRKLVQDEHRETGGVKWSIYKSYLKASSYWTWAFLALFVVVNQLLGLAEKFWIKFWGDAYGKAEYTSSYWLRSFAASEVVYLESFIPGHHHVTSFHGLRTMWKSLNIDWPNPTDHPLFYVGIYASIGLINALVNILTIAVQYTGGLRASRILFRQLLVTVVRATFRFHDTTPQGRILNRFGKDIETIDSSLAGSLQSVNWSLASFFASVLTVAFVFPWFFIPALLIGLAYRELAIGYLNTGRDLRRMESNSRSPIFSDFGELLEGIATVRAFSAEKRFLDNLHRKIDVTTKMWYTYWMTDRWLLLNFDALGALAILITMLSSILTLQDNPGLAGVCITSAMAFTTSVYWTCRFWTTLELDLNSVERVIEYLDLPQEPPAIIESNRVPAYWPSSSNRDSMLVVEDLVIKYAPELPTVLQNISFTLKAGERVGLLGRTGSGKSTLAMSILRFVDPASGRIIIDGIDISTIGLYDLRSRLTFIPQDVTLFSGSLRDNLDPFKEHSDEECLDVLCRVQMISQSLPDSAMGLRIDDTADAIPATTTDIDIKTIVTLDTQISPGGTNFSQGQRQLITMARALLRRSSIIILDEATSSIDFATDAKIQATIRKEFTESLLLTVAHRLRTVIDYDRLVVLDKGRVAEFDTPWNLIQKKDGIFRNMCLKSGTFGELEAVAKAQAGLQ